MINRLTFLLAWRYLLGSTHGQKNVSTMVKICFIGIFIGTFSLALVTAVMNGFEDVFHVKMQGIHAQVIVRAYGDDQLNMEKLTTVLTNEFPQIEAFAPSTTRQLIIQKKKSDDISNVVLAKAIVPEDEARVSILQEKITNAQNQKTLIATLDNNHILIGENLAQSLGLKVGDEVNILFSDDSGSRSRNIKLNRTSAIIGGTFDTGIDEFDSGIVFTTFGLLEKMFSDVGATQINIKLQNNVNEQSVINRMKNRLTIDVSSWQDLYPALVSALKLEKYAMFLILALITLVASMNIISLLFMQITQKRGDIAILKAMGMAGKDIKYIFIIMGSFIACLGSIFGIIAAFIVACILDRYPLIQLPDAYYISHLPVKIEFTTFALVFLVTMTLSILATWLAARVTDQINISNVLRFEG